MIFDSARADLNFLRIAAVRIVGYALYNAWVLCTFSNTLLFVMADDKRGALYLNYLVSLVVLCVTLATLFRVVKRPDKFVLSRRCIYPAGVVLSLATLFLPFSDMESAAGMVLFVTSAVATGSASGLLFLAWCRLYCDLEVRTLVSEMAIAWAAAGCMGIFVSAFWLPVAVCAVVAMGVASALLLRWSVCHRPLCSAEVRTCRAEAFHGMIRSSFKRGMLACSCIAFIAGFSDVASGFCFIPVPESYEIRIALGTFVVALGSFVVARFVSRSYIRALWRFSILVIAVGCLLMQFVVELDGLSDILICCGYQVPLMILLCGICSEVSNRRDIVASKVFGMAFSMLYVGNVLGSCLAHILVLVVKIPATDLGLVSLIASLVITVVALVLFTEGDLVGALSNELAGENSPRSVVDSSVGAVRAQDKVSDHFDSVALSEQLAGEYGLTPRESEVLLYLLRGRSLSSIQNSLYISQGTANTHVRHIYRKMGVHSRRDLFDLADAVNGREERVG